MRSYVTDLITISITIFFNANIMSVQSKTALQSTINSQITTNGTNDITTAQLNAILDNMVDSYEDFIGSYTTAQIAALVGMTTRQIVYDTTLGGYFYYSGTRWKPFCCTRLASLNLTSAQILALNSTPLTIVAAQGANTIIVPIKCIGQFTYVSATYATYTTVYLTFDLGVSASPVVATNWLNATASQYKELGINSNALFLANTDLKAFAITGNPTTGDGTAKIWVWYKVLEL